MKGVAKRPPTELIRTTRPFAARNIGRNAWVTATCPIRLTSIWRRKSSMGRASSGPGIATPALLTSPARRPAAGLVHERSSGGD